jgi:hypothetical protein
MERSGNTSNAVTEEMKQFGGATRPAREGVAISGNRSTNVCRSRV